MRLERLLATQDNPPSTYLWPRWIVLRGLGLIFLSAFYSLAFQIHGLIGERGILPAGEYLHNARGVLGTLRAIWYAPTLLWLGAGDWALTIVVAAGILCSLLLTANVSPRLTTIFCTALFLSCVAALQDFSSYQSDGMLLEAGFIACWFAPRGIRPKLGASDPPSRFSVFMLRWEWFRIYFESGIVKLASGDPHWRNLTAMDEYYQNGPLPTWLGWYVEHWPHWFHAGTVIFTLLVELVLVWMLWLRRPFRVVCFVIVTGLQLSIIATANYAFLNYLVLLLGVLLLDDQTLARLRLRLPTVAKTVRRRPRWARHVETATLGVLLYVTVMSFIPDVPILGLPAQLLAPFRIANAYGLFAVMTEGRYEIEFQGSRDGTTWIAYPFRYKPQDVRERPGIYAPFQPRFDWNLWFASLGPWQQSQWVVNAQLRLTQGSPSVLRLFRSDPFGGNPPTLVRTVLWQYSFTDDSTKRATGAWWRRQLIGPFTGTVALPR
ncbi:MAG TPA: lipase maturation factor family protein [Gemmatimonadaceae bacterium]|nr:lipase maturation factor family protein [Gemmatimonadaceae bacterium]